MQKYKDVDCETNFGLIIRGNPERSNIYLNIIIESIEHENRKLSHIFDYKTTLKLRILLDAIIEFMENKTDEAVDKIKALQKEFNLRGKGDENNDDKS